MGRVVVTGASGFLGSHLYDRLVADGHTVVGFDATEPQDTTEHGQTGYLAEPYDTDDLAEGIDRVLDASELRTTFAEQARARAV